MKRIPTVCMLAAMLMIAADDPKKDAEALKGNWTAASIKHAGQALPADQAKTFKLTFDAKTYTNKVGDEFLEEGGFTIDPSKTPKTMDFDIKKGPDEGKKQLAIYQLDGDKLTIVAAFPGATERPKSLKPEASAEVIEAVFERTKS